MPEKKAKAAKKAAPRKTSKGDGYVCESCGLSVIVDEMCGCTEVHELICCGQPMTEKKTKARA